MRRIPLCLLTITAFLGCGKDSSDDGSVDTSGPVVVDEDGDGVALEEDCDDEDASVGAVDLDADCDGVLTADDCDDEDAESTVIAEDADCDGVLTADDCNDEDSESTVLAEDADCDGVLTAADCDDEDAESTIIAEDADCDGVLTAEDCDDEDAESTVIAEDADCDGVLTANDCDDSDSSMNWNDTDGDGYASCDGDCDDGDADRNPEGTDGMLSDRDCDGLAAGGSITDADYKFVGEKSQDYAGRMVADAGDVDGDGLDDVLVGAPYNGSSRQGAAYLFLAKNLGSESTLDLRDADYKFEGIEVNDYAGMSMSSAGDVDGDGLADILIGTYDAGAFLVLGKSLGSENTLSLADADFRFEGEESIDRPGFKLDGAGDVDGDGLGDVLISSPGNGEGGSGAGAVYLVLGASLSTPGAFSLADADYKFMGEVELGNAGWSVAFAGDVDGDSLSDVLVGSNTEIGTVHLFLSSSLPSGGTLPLSSADYLFESEFAADRLGWSVDAAGDMDGDGLGDLVFGAYSNDELIDGGGAIYVVLGGSLGGVSTIGMADADYKFLGKQKWIYTGHSVAGAGDLDSDGLDDLLIGVPEDHGGGEDSGAVHVLLGSVLTQASSNLLQDVSAKLVGESSSARLGIAVCSAGDVDGDGVPDVLMGAYGEDEGGDYAGAGYLIFGGD